MKSNRSYGSRLEVARINDVALVGKDELVAPDELRQRGCSELLRQAAISRGFLRSDDISIDGIISEAASEAIETLLDKTLAIAVPTVEECLRYYQANQAKYRKGERVRMRHILFAVTERVNVTAIRNRAETALLDVRCHNGKLNDDIFAKTAGSLSNCPSGSDGGDLGWLRENECVPEIAKAIFGHNEVGVLPQLIHSRFGLHIIDVLEREAGIEQEFGLVSQEISMTLQRVNYVKAIGHFLRGLAESATIVDVNLELDDVSLARR